MHLQKDVTLFPAKTTSAREISLSALFAKNKAIVITPEVLFLRWILGFESKPKLDLCKKVQRAKKHGPLPVDPAGNCFAAIRKIAAVWQKTCLAATRTLPAPPCRVLVSMPPG